jgi:hypothetical protein
MASRLTKSSPSPANQKTRPPVVVSRTALPQRIPTQDEIRTRAYQKWEAAGRPDGESVLFWLEAEQELKR